MGAVASVLDPPPDYKELDDLVKLTQRLIGRMREMVHCNAGCKPTVFQTLRFAEMKKQFLVASARIEKAIGPCEELTEYYAIIEELEGLFYVDRIGISVQPLISK